MPFFVSARPRRAPVAAAIIVAAIAIAVAVPAAAAAAPHAVIAGPVTVHGYAMSVVGVTGERVLTVQLERRHAGSIQEHVYTFTTKGIRVGDRRIRATLGRLGAVDLRLVAGDDTHLPAGCRGHALSAGTWTGSLTLAADTTYFHTIRARRLPGAALPVDGTECDPPGAPTSAPAGPTLQSTSGRPVLTAADHTATVLLTTHRGGASIVHAATAPSTITPAADLSAATLNPKGSLLTGSVAFAGSTAAATAADGPAGQTAVGALTGSLTAHFDSIGAVTVATGTKAILQQLP